MIVDCSGIFTPTSSGVTGFNAADPSLVGVHWLVQGMRAEERIEGDRAFRPDGGFGRLVEIFREQSSRHDQTVHTGAVVERVTWSPGHVELAVTDSKGRSALKARRILVTLPLAVLKTPLGQPGAVEFLPPLSHTRIDAMNRLEMGKVIRVSLTFRERFWDDILPSIEGARTLSDMGFLLSQDEWHNAEH